MPTNDFLTFVVVVVAVLVITPILGTYIYRVMEGQRTL